MLPITPLLFPSCPDLLLEELAYEGQTLFLTVRRSRKAMPCPDCGNVSMKVHSRYHRTLADVSLMDYEVRLRVHVRRFFCTNAECARITFAESFADLAVPHARRTNRQASRLRAMAKELGGRSAARESENVLMSVSRHTLLRLLRKAVLGKHLHRRVAVARGRGVGLLQHLHELWNNTHYRSAPESSLEEVADRVAADFGTLIIQGSGNHWICDSFRSNGCKAWMQRYRTLLLGCRATPSSSIGIASAGDICSSCASA